MIMPIIATWCGKSSNDNANNRRQVSIPDGYRRLPYKTIAGFLWAADLHVQPRYLGKIRTLLPAFHLTLSGVSWMAIGDSSWNFPALYFIQYRYIIEEG